MQYMVFFEVNQPTDMSQAELYQIWNDEADAALGAKEAGVVKGLWKAAGQRTVYALLDVPDPETLDAALEGLPIVQQMGGAVDIESVPVYDYEQWAAHVKKTLG